MSDRIVHHSWADCCRIGPESQSSFDGYRVLLVGEDNPQNVRSEYALWATPSKEKRGCAGKNLQSKILGLGHSDYYALWRTNLCTNPPGWVRYSAETRMAHLLSGAHPWRTVVCLGRKVTSCAEAAAGFEIPTWTWAPLWSELDTGDVHIAVVSIPHPSGLCREWNDPASVERARALLREVEPEVPWGSLGTIPVDLQARE